MNEIINKILEEMEPFLSKEQNERLVETMKKAFSNGTNYNLGNEELLELFISSKRIEGLSERTLDNYTRYIMKFVNTVNKPFRFISTDDVRLYLSNYHQNSNCNKSTLENIRSFLSGFFYWLQEEGYVLSNPVRRINKIKQTKQVKQVVSEEALEKLRMNCKTERDLAIIDMLYSTGIRVSELVNININDVNFEEREVIVHGKGDKYRPAYFDARTKYHLLKYIESREDDNPALFVSLIEPHERLTINAVERRIRDLARKVEIERVHPHMFRRTMATRAIEKGMPVEQVQKILGHSQINTTMVYAVVNQHLVKESHRKYLN